MDPTVAAAGVSRASATTVGRASASGKERLGVKAKKKNGPAGTTHLLLGLGKKKVKSVGVGGGGQRTAGAQGKGHSWKANSRLNNRSRRWVEVCAPRDGFGGG